MPHEIRDCCGVLDTLLLARRMHPGQRNSLDALAKRYSVDNSKRDLHGALLDAQILTDIYLAMTGGQVSLSLDNQEQRAEAAGPRVEQRVDRSGLNLVVRTPSRKRSWRTRRCWRKSRSAAAERSLGLPSRTLRL